MRDMNDNNDSGELAWKNRMMISGLSGMREALERGPADQARPSTSQSSQTDEFSGDADIESMLAMRVHFQRTLEMAQAELVQTTDSHLRSIAHQVIETKSREIAQLDLWLQAHRGPQQDSASK